MSTQNLIALVEKVAELRCVSTDAGRFKESAVIALQAMPEYEHLERATETEKKAIGDVLKAEAELKDTALELYKETKEKKPIDKVEVKIFKRLEYDPTEALAWCRTNAPSLLVVNKKPFEKTAVEIGAPVKVSEEAKCTIGGDLSSYLPTQEKQKAKPKGEKDVE